MFWASENSVGPVTFYLNWPCWLVESLVLSLPLTSEAYSSGTPGFALQCALLFERSTWMALLVYRFCPRGYS